MIFELSLCLGVEEGREIIPETSPHSSSKEEEMVVGMMPYGFQFSLREMRERREEKRVEIGTTSALG